MALLMNLAVFIILIYMSRGLNHDLIANLIQISPDWERYPKFLLSYTQIPLSAAMSAGCEPIWVWFKSMRPP